MDCASVSGKLTFQPGVAALNLSIPIRPDMKYEPHETFTSI
jgi:hypothetical protein